MNRRIRRENKEGSSMKRTIPLPNEDAQGLEQSYGNAASGSEVNGDQMAPEIPSGEKDAGKQDSVDSEQGQASVTGHSNRSLALFTIYRILLNQIGRAD